MTPFLFNECGVVKGTAGVGHSCSGKQRGNEKALLPELESNDL